MRNLFAALFLLLMAGSPSVAQEAIVWLGASGDDLTMAEAKALGLEAPRGSKISAVTPNSPAEAAGLKPGDVIVSLDGTEIQNNEQFFDNVTALKPGTKLALSLNRGGKLMELNVTLGSRLLPAADKSPQLALDTGGHQAFVTDLAVTPDGRQIVSASNDKTVRVWDIASGKTTRVIRGETMPGNWGTIYSMALSPDAKLLAIGGFLSEADRLSGSAIHLYNFITGKVVRVMKGHKNVVVALAFSPDGKRLLSGSADKTAIIWDVDGGVQVQQLSGHAGTVSAVSFSPDGERVVTGSEDETLRLWRTDDGGMLTEMTHHRTSANALNDDDKVWRGQVKSAAFSPDARLIASGSLDGRVMLWNGTNGAFERELVFMGGMVGSASINSVAFSADSRRLLFASEFEGCIVYDVAAGKEIWQGKLLDEPTTRMFSKVKRPDCTGGAVFSPDGKLAIASYNNLVYVLQPGESEPLKTLQGSGKPIFGVGFGKDGRSIAWGTEIGRGELAPLTFRLNLPFEKTPLGVPEAVPIPVTAPAEPTPSDRPRLGEDKPDPLAGLFERRSAKSGPLAVEFKKLKGMLQNTSVITVNNGSEAPTEIKLQQGGGKHSVLGLTPDARTIMMTSQTEIKMIDRHGKELAPFVGHMGTVRDFAISADGRYMVSGGSDHTVRLWNVETRELIVSLFYGVDGEWVIWTPQGYYASSPNGDRIVGWQINKGAGQAAEYVSASQLRSKFYRPDIVDRAIILASATRALEEMKYSDGMDFRLSDLAQRLPPRLAVLSPDQGNETSTGRATIKLALAETKDDPVDRFDLFVNDIKVTAAAKRSDGEVSFEVPLGKGGNLVRVVARSASNLLAEAQLGIVQRGEGALDKRNTLYILAIGADKYPLLPKVCGQNGRGPCDLSFAGADAKAFSATIEKQMGRQHLRVVKRLLVNGEGGDREPTRANVENALETLRQSKENDTVVVFIAGHGVNAPQTGYQFLPSDARYLDDKTLSSGSVVKWAIIEEAIQSAKGRRLLFVDTCRSTNAFNPRLMKQASDDAIVAFSATNTQQDALELFNLGHGAFTSAVVKGLNGAADIAQEREVRVFDLGTYVEREVRKLTKGLQTPDFYKKPGAENFVLVRMTNEVAASPAQVPVSAPQPVASPAKPAAKDQRPAETKPVALPITPAPAAPPAPPKTAAAPAPVDKAPPKPAILLISPGEEAERLKRGQSALANDDIAGARLIFEYLANRGSAAGAYQLAQTYDPQYQTRSPFGLSIKPDWTLAEQWYRKAAELGHPKAREALAADQ
jgi:WD40 repeat protein/uncharacterized caspase-like protein